MKTEDFPEPWRSWAKGRYEPEGWTLPELLRARGSTYATMGWLVWQVVKDPTLRIMSYKQAGEPPAREED